MKIKQLLETLAAKPLGPQPSFQSIQLLEALLAIGREAPIGRKRLSEKLSLGEGAVRTLLQRLKAESLIEVIGKGGCVLSEKGRALLSELEGKLKDVGPTRLKLPWSYPEDYAIIVKGAARLVRRGLEQRDEAIRAGARALLVLTYVDGRLLMPGISDITLERPDFASKLIEELKPENEDVILIAGALHLTEAKRGALAAAQTLL